MIKNAWYALGLSAELEGGKLEGMTVAGRPMVAWRDVDGGVHVLDGRCAHKRFPLAKGRLLEDGNLECGYHGFRFDGCGRCVGIPALEGTQARLERPGFVDVEAWTNPEPTSFPTDADLVDFLETVCLRQHVATLAPGERHAFAERAAAAMEVPVIDYVRLNIVARRAAA